ncbi:BON domain-containing protein [Desulfitibacter alkalitolerans]|uniref:BON domain-containing protein n=1 Tax=Desulfitibacter alkalitolerans TaxID=264641 RepID=UPI0004825749|nr:BON domain-containing protein [Desulfitibacter alkalitolerans]
MKLNDSQVKDAIMTALMKDGMSDINVNVRKGIASIWGVVDVLDDRNKVETVVKRIPGVKKVENKLVISADGEIGDDKVAEMISKKLFEKPGLDRLTVEVHKGIALLMGNIDSIDQERKAIIIASKVLGVKEIISKLKIKDEHKKDDATLVNEIERAISLEESLDLLDIRTQVKDGRVILSGTVDKANQAILAEDAASAVKGVRRITNKLQAIESGGQDNRLTKRVRILLAQQPHINNENISVFVVAGTAYLSGEVYTSGSKKAAEVLAASVPGILRVINNIHIDHH